MTGPVTRIADPASIAETEIAEALRQGRVVVQFSRADAYTPSLLETLNDICRRSSDQLCIRFHSHGEMRFDAAILRHLPDVKSLAVDYLRQIANEDEIGRLPALTRLDFGIHDFDRPDFLETLDLGRLTGLRLYENRKRNLDLAPLAGCAALERLFVQGHAKGIEAIAGLPCLETLRLWAFAKVHGIAFLSRMPQLAKLVLALGGRDDIDALASDSLRSLHVIRVQGLSRLGDLARFPKLKHLQVQEQARLRHLDLTGAALERLGLLDCKALASLAGLETQSGLREFFARSVALDMDALRDFAWPATTTSVRLTASGKKWNEATRDLLADRGYGNPHTSWE